MKKLYALFLVTLPMLIGQASQAIASKPPAAFNRTGDPFCSASSANILIVGTSHFSNPGLDSHNVVVDDVLAARRQGQIQEVADRLAAFRPTKVMVEAPYRDPSVLLAYRNYLSGKHSLSTNEVEQLGFRIARMAGIQQITPIDFEMRMSGFRPDELDDNWTPKPAAQPSPNGNPATASADPLSEADRQLRDGTIRTYLLYLNDPDHVAKDHSSYMDKFEPIDSPVLYEHADYLANWYKRNIRMFANVVRETKFPSDRVLLIVGSGHVKILSDFARDADYFCLANTNAFLG